MTKIATLMLLLLHSHADSLKIRTVNRFDSLRGSDSIQITRCDIVCSGSEDKECHRMCMRDPFVKRGSCPESFENISLFVRACVNFCSRDNDCPGTEKCCEHSCGFTCKPAFGLDREEDLPPVPRNVTVTKRKGVHLSWTMPDARNQQKVMYVLQERRHLGAYYNERLLGEWNPIFSTTNTTATLRGVLKAGHFYQFRVASVNINGSRGFSAGSNGFSLARPPVLQKPKNLRVENVEERNGTIWGLMQWKPSKSPIPIEKYKIFWSFKLDESLFKYNSDALITQRATVPEHELSFQLKNLIKDKLYYVQVQAVANYGPGTLKSGKAQMLFDTSKLENQYERRRRKGTTG